MNALNTPPRTTWQEFDRLRDEARQRAQALRAEAMNDFWRGLVDTLSAPRLSAQRAAVRYAQRLARHTQLRARATNAGASGVTVPEAPSSQ